MMIFKMKSKRINRCIVIAAIFSYALLLFHGCALFYKKPPMALKKISPGHYPGFFDDMAYEGLENSICQSLSYLMLLPSEREFRFGKDSYDTNHMIKSLEIFLSFIRKNPTQHELEKFIAAEYLVYKSIGMKKTGQVLFTGYYEPSLEGSLVKTDEYRFPVYTLPEDRAVINLSLFSDKFVDEKKLIGRFTEEQTIVPYYEREEIETLKPLENKAETIAWVKDKVDLFFLEIQGSGKIYLDNGEWINAHYHGTNGHPYRAIGRLLIDQGKILKEEMSMQKIRMYLDAHPEERQEILNYNKSYVFFKKEDGGPFGCLQVELTPGRSLALQRRIFPSAALAFIETQRPFVGDSGEIQSWMDFGRFVLNQDTGGAIKGPGRADIFWGNGEYAEIAAGHMQHDGALFFLVLKPEASE